MRKRPLPEYFKGLICEIEGCNKPATSIIRTKHVCSDCYSIILKDNIRLFDSDQEIPDSLLIHKNCYKYKCIKRIPTVLKYVNGELLPKYCSEKCEQEDKEITEFYEKQGIIHNHEKDI